MVCTFAVKGVYWRDPEFLHKSESAYSWLVICSQVVHTAQHLGADDTTQSVFQCVRWRQPPVLIDNALAALLLGTAFYVQLCGCQSTGGGLKASSSR